jgi:hypothetical protein
VNRAKKKEVTPGRERPDVPPFVTLTNQRRRKSRIWQEIS